MFGSLMCRKGNGTPGHRVPVHMGVQKRKHDGVMVETSLAHNSMHVDLPHCIASDVAFQPLHGTENRSGGDPVVTEMRERPTRCVAYLK